MRCNNASFTKTAVNHENIKTMQTTQIYNEKASPCKTVTKAAQFRISNATQLVARHAELATEKFPFTTYPGFFLSVLTGLAPKSVDTYHVYFNIYNRGSNIAIEFKTVLVISMVNGHVLALIDEGIGFADLTREELMGPLYCRYGSEFLLLDKE
jgi:hypothetical protein